MRLDRAVDSFTWREAVVAGPACDEWFSTSPLVGFPEILEELDATALGALAKLDELHEVSASDRLFLLIRDTIDQTMQPRRIGSTVK